MHRLLERQLQKSFGRKEGFTDELQRFIHLVNAAYRESDEDRALLDRSMRLSSQELSQRNASLRAAEQKYRAIFENATEGIFQTTADGRFIAANPALAAILGYDGLDDLLSLVTDVGRQIYVDPARRRGIEREIAEHGGSTQCESQARRKDGHIIWISETTRAVRGSDGSVERYEGTIHDVTKRKQAEIERAEMQDRLLRSRQSGMAEVATGVLHNIGNVLNSVNVSVSMLGRILQESKLSGLERAVELISQHKDDLPRFLGEDSKGQKVFEYIIRLTTHLGRERSEMRGELASLTQNLEHIKRIVSLQQEHAKVSGFSEALRLPDLVEDALKLCSATFDNGVEVVREFTSVPDIHGERHQIMQILVNLISNARHAMVGSAQTRRLTLRVGPSPATKERFIIQVSDTGVGIPKDNLTRIFNHGFTTKPKGHGFGLHSAALASHAMGGSLTVQSDGPGCGATFTLELPLTSRGMQARQDSAA